MYLESFHLKSWKVAITQTRNFPNLIHTKSAAPLPFRMDMPTSCRRFITTPFIAVQKNFRDMIRCPEKLA